LCSIVRDGDVVIAMQGVLVQVRLSAMMRVY